MLTWVCVVVLALLSLVPASFGIQSERITGLPATVNHFMAYAGAAGIAVAAYYGRTRGTPIRILVLLSAYAGILEYLQHFSPGRHPDMPEFATSVLGALAGGLVVVMFWPRLAKALGAGRPLPPSG